MNSAPKFGSYPYLQLGGSESTVLRYLQYGALWLRSYSYTPVYTRVSVC